jgi:hypothetical protein
MPQRITCHVCGKALIIRDDAPPTVTCPNCLARISTRSPGAAAPMPRRPIPVIPLEHEVSGDFQAATRNVFILALVLIVGGFLTAMRWSSTQIGSWLVFLGIAIAAAASAHLRQQSRQRSAQPELAPPPQYEGLPPPPPELDSFGRPLLSYGRPTDERGVRVLPFIGGFFGGLGMCAVAMFAMATSLDFTDGPRNIMKLGLLGALAAMFIIGLAGARALGRRRAWSGIGRGAAIGVGLGMMAVGPCALCYLSF